MAEYPKQALPCQIYLYPTDNKRQALPFKINFASASPGHCLACCVKFVGVQGFFGPELTITELYYFQLANGATYALFTPHGEDLNTSLGTAQAIPIKRGPIQYKANLQVDKVTISMGLIGVKIGTQQYSIPDVIKRGYLRGCKVAVYAYDYAEEEILKTLFVGEVKGEISYDGGIFNLDVNSFLDKLKDTVPKPLYTETCNHRLWDSRCRLNAGTYQQIGTVTAVDGRRIWADVFAYSNEPQDWWTRGKLVFSSGNNQGIGRMMLVHGDGYIDTMLKFPETISVGDTFLVWPGCDRTGQMCDEKFSNYNNFFGFEYIPKPEVLYG